eukprot:TRINITY_DN5046_c0_g2_i1.p1 TRINITY_DN5046_c0_g2~~TRINITY_DN5046_c0_g2_i1.p1  ORF type:complete len:308 (-),score=21.36 TRINITY_DN5046_c0_g2_i1:108-989(-)
MYYVSLAASLAPFIAYYSEVWDLITSLVLAPLFLQSLTLVGNSWCGPLWQISAFMISYLLYPFFIRFLIKYKSPKITGFFCFIFPLIVFGLFFFMEWPLGIAHTWAIIRVPHFMIGAVLGYLFMEHKQFTKGRYFEAFLVDVCSFLLGVSFFGCMILGKILGQQFWWEYMLWAEFSLIPLLCVWIYFMAKTPHGFTIWFFNLFPLQKLGDLSYSIYVLHWPVMHYYNWLKNGEIVPTSFRNRDIKMGEDDLVDGWWALNSFDLLPIICITICLTVLFEHYIESRCRLLIRKFA